MNQPRPAAAPGPATGPASGTGPDAARRVWRNLWTLMQERGDRRAEVAEALGMSFFRTKVLRRLAAAPEPFTLRGLADLLGTDRPYVTLVVDDLVERGFVERTPNPADRRSKLVTVTGAGREAAAEAERILGTPPAVLYELPPEDLAVLDRVAARLVEDQ
ncbi:MarR family winged helix-turn-helix transcriptional regulator [Actinomadura violacea]|uniref:MarR family transcriptional regulator n=1 Tax=Actinomadura violacea TaxID=2819934 RepID=A0ABS3RS67_9ACTN|nr:MarR family transcriptional regulator [Actinomadura violacea]MBO2459592.1 MarR family transcriptional regulator [Actinomadura violacea]